jgi:hypothetical protein
MSVASIRDVETQSEPSAELTEKVRQLALEVQAKQAVIDELRSLLLEAHDQLLRRDQEIEELLRHVLEWLGMAPPPNLLPSTRRAPQGTAPAAQPEGTEVNHHLYYQQVILHVREVVQASVPAAGVVIVVSKGDDQLLQFDGRTGWHFPQTADGVYAGHYPADSTGAVAHLEALRRQGGQYFLLPNQAFWWLDSYPGLRGHLEQCAEGIHLGQHCRLYRLGQAPLGLWRRAWRWLTVPRGNKPAGERGGVRSAVPPTPAG